jgi:putative phage-type endonuclease
VNDLQGTAEWQASRAGKVTASRVADVVAKTKSGASASRANYMAELIVERLTGVKGDSYQTPAMVWGIETEPKARAAYEAETGHLVTGVGFIPHPTINMAGASPDGWVGDEGGIEIKCPNTATHIETVLSEAVPAKYVTQMQWQMACHPGQQWIDFISYDPRVPETMQMWVKRVERDDKYIAQLEEEVFNFIEELEAKIDALKEKYNGL